MDYTIKEEIEQLKRQLNQQKETISDIGQLVKQEIDKPISINLWEFSEKELDCEMGNNLSLLNDQIDVRPSKHSIVSHRKFIGRFIVFLKRIMLKLTSPYTNVLLDKQIKFNQDLVRFQLASFIRLRRIEDKISVLDEKLNDLLGSQSVSIITKKDRKTKTSGSKKRNGK